MAASMASRLSADLPDKHCVLCGSTKARLKTLKFSKSGKEHTFDLLISWFRFDDKLVKIHQKPLGTCSDDSHHVHEVQHDVHSERPRPTTDHAEEMLLGDIFRQQVYHAESGQGMRVCLRCHAEVDSVHKKCEYLSAHLKRTVRYTHQIQPGSFTTPRLGPTSPPPDSPDPIPISPNVPKQQLLHANNNDNIPNPIMMLPASGIFSESLEREVVSPFSIASPSTTVPVKRLRETPGSSQPERKRRPRVIEDVISSVEKMKLSDPANLPEAAVKPITSKKKLAFDFEEHQYSKPLVYINAKETKLQAEKTLREMEAKLYAKNPSKPVSISVQGDTQSFVDALFKSPSVKNAIEQKLISDIKGSFRQFVKGKSVVKTLKDPEFLTQEDIFSQIFMAIVEELPFLANILISLGSPVEPSHQRIATVATVVSMFCHSVDNKASALQHLFSTLAIDGGASTRLWSELNYVHLTLSASRKIAIQDNYVAYSDKQLLSVIREKQFGKINGDNLDIFVKTKEMRVGSGNKDLHYFASDWTADRIPGVTEELLKKVCHEQKPSVDEITVQDFLPNQEETKLFRESLEILLGRILQEDFACFKWMKLVLPGHIPHPLVEEMSQKTASFILPLQLKNEAKYEDCLDILDSYEDTIDRLYRQAGLAGELEKLQVPVGGDQLTVRRFEGTKALRAGAHLRRERFENLSPVIIEMFHTIMDFLEKMCKRFLKLKAIGDQGTAANLKALIQRKSVNGKVKSRYAVHMDFVQTLGRCYLREFVCELFGMENSNSSLKSDLIPDNVERLHRGERSKVFKNVMNEILDNLLVTFGQCTAKTKDQPKQVQLDILLSGVTSQIKVPLTGELVTVIVKVGALSIPITVLYKNVTTAWMAYILKLPTGLTIDLRIKRSTTAPEKPDDLFNYARQFLQCYFVMLNFEDTVKEGDICRMNVLLKVMIPFFYSHSALSKYFVECMDYIFKTEVVLEQEMSVRVRALSFVNLKGGQGNNMATDMHKEIQVRMLKDSIRSLGAHKTDRAIVRACGALDVTHKVVENVDSLFNINSGSSHPRKSSEEDEKLIDNKLRKLKPFQHTPGRTLENFSGISADPFANFERERFENHLMSVLGRLKFSALSCEDADIHNGSVSEEDSDN